MIPAFASGLHGLHCQELVSPETNASAKPEHPG